MGNRGKPRRTLWVVLASLLVVGGIAAWTIQSSIDKYHDKVENLQIGHVDLSNIEEGTYPGSCDLGLVGVTVEVTVKRHRIEDVRLIEHRKGTGAPAEALIGDIIREQTLDLDVVSGATASSKAILKAVESALAGKPLG